MTHDLINSAKHWESLANSEEAMAAWNRERGLDLSSPGDSCGDHRAKLYRKVATAQRLHAETGVPHCLCHLSKLCPLGNTK